MRVKSNESVHCTVCNLDVIWLLVDRKSKGIAMPQRPCDY